MDSRPHTPSRWSLLGTALPILLVSACIALFGLNIPFVDQFRFLPTLAKAQQGALTFGDLFAQINENRPFFPRLIWLGLAAVTRYDVRAELWANLALALLTFAAFAASVLRLSKRAGVTVPSLLLPLIALSVFNLAQWESWLQGYQLVMFLGMACVVIGLVVLARRPSWGAFAVAVIAGVIGSFSTPNDLLYWPIGLCVLLMTAARGQRLWRAIVWSSVAAACFVVFLRGWKPTPDSDISVLAAAFVPRLEWLANFLGAPLASVPGVALPFGALGVGLLLYIIWALAKAGTWREAVPYLAIAAFVAATGLMISMGRLRLGVIYAVTPRYLTISAWYWAALLALVPLARLPRLLPPILYSLLGVTLLLHSAWGAYNARAMHARMLPAYEAALARQPMTDEVLQGIAAWWQYEDARAWLAYLQERHLSAYANTR